MVKPKDTQKKPFASHLHRLSFMNMRDLIRNDAQTGTDNIFIKEDIAVARSIRPLIGKFNSREPFFMVDARMGIIRKGHGHYTVNLMETDFREGDVVYMSRGSIVQVGEMSDDFDFTGVAFDEDHLNLAFNGQPPLLFQQYAYHRILHASAAEFDTFNRYMDTLWAITQLPYDTRRLAGKSVGPLLSLFELCIARQEERKPNPVSHNREMFNRFVRLINEHVHEAHTLDFYASRLCLSPRYVGCIVKNISGKTAKYWIDRALVNQAKVMLLHSDRQVTDIARLLGFPTSSFFCRFFRQHTGHTPQEYRQHTF